MRYEDDFFKALSKLDKDAFLAKMVNEAGVLSVNFSKERFRKKQWVDKSIQPWEKRKRKSSGSLLVKSGRLKRSIRKIANGKYYVLIGTDVPYAQIHNKGGFINKSVNVRAHRRKRTRNTYDIKAHKRKMNLKIPKRQFLGDSEHLSIMIEKHMYIKALKELKK